MLTNTNPFQLSTRSWRSAACASLSCGNSQRHGMLWMAPSSDHSQPWNGQAIEGDQPLAPEGLSLVPRWMQLLWNARKPASARTIRIEWRPIS